MTELIAVEEASDGVRYVTLNRPEKKNAISTPMRAELPSFRPMTTTTMFGSRCSGSW